MNMLFDSAWRGVCCSPIIRQLPDPNTHGSVSVKLKLTCGPNKDRKEPVLSLSLAPLFELSISRPDLPVFSPVLKHDMDNTVLR